MITNRSSFKVLAAVFVLVTGLINMHLSHAADTSPAIKVDSSPIDRDPHSGNSYAPVIKKVWPSVVNIYSSRIVKEHYYDPITSDPLFRRFFGGQGDGGQEVSHRENWLGCGIIVAPDGYIITANHVVEGADEIKVNLQNDKTYSAKVIGLDPPTDVAILKIEGKNLPAVTLGDSDQLEVGDVVLAIGNPFGIGQTVTRGIISALGRTLSDSDDPDQSVSRQYQNFIQTDAAINEGNSGGALIDAQGRLIGINDAIISPSGASAGIGFAVPVNMARGVLTSFLSNGHVARGYMGVGPQDLDAGLAHSFGAPSTAGALVAEVTPDSPAAKAGLLVGDVIVAINGKDVSGADNLRLTISQIAPGTDAKVKLYRKGVEKTVSVTLAERPDSQPASAPPGGNNSTVEPAKADALDGVQVENLTPRLRRHLRADPGLVGAIVVDVNNASNSYQAGLRPGDVILELDKQPVANADDAVRICKASRNNEILVKVWRPDGAGGRIRYLDVDNTHPTN